MLSSSEKPTVTSWISRGNGVCIAAISIRSWVAQSVVRYVDVMTITKRGSVIWTAIHGILLILILGQLDRAISIFVVKREQESFTGWGVTARTWKENISLTLLSISFENRNRYIQKQYGIKSSLEQHTDVQQQNKSLSRGADQLAKAFIPVRKKLVDTLVRGASAKWDCYVLGCSWWSRSLCL